MGKITVAAPVKLVAGLIFKNEIVLNKTQKILNRLFGETDYASPIIPFSFTDYYDEEMGPGLKRKFLSFKKLIPSPKLAEIKILTNKIEAMLSRGESREINIDPGYLTLAKLVLASTKDYYHRIAISKNIFAEITLYYKNNNFNFFEWTYPDYKSSDYLKVFLQIREIYAQQIKKA